jgi:SAM-dependent methyltransferase
MTQPSDETQRVAERYARRAAVVGDRYSVLRPNVWQSVHERQRAMLRLFASLGLDLSSLQILEVGCGSGGNLLELLQWGCHAEHLGGIELLPERFAAARHALPVAVQLWQGDATTTPVAAASQDIVLQSTVFSSLLDDAFQQQLAQRMWAWVKPGGAVLWYDFTVNNPHNPDVRGVPMQRVRALFPEGRITHQRVTLAPPIARAVTHVHPALYTVFNTLPLLRTHVLAWIAKPL